MVDEVTSAAYSGRSAEYIELLGSMGSVHPADLQFVSSWADDVDGEIIDAGCGPGHWTNFLAEQGHSARGVDLVPEFIAHARSAYPSVKFTPGGMLLIGFFEGPVVERFAHLVTPAYRWPVDALSAELSATGFDVVKSRVRTITGQRSQATITARRRESL